MAHLSGWPRGIGTWNVDAERELGGHARVSSLRATALPDIPHKLEDLHRRTFNHAVARLAGCVAQVESGGEVEFIAEGARLFSSGDRKPNRRKL
jgi:hypothetical protein